MNTPLLSYSRFTYKRVLKPLLFLMDPETVHTHIVGLGESSGESKIIRSTISSLYREEYPELRQSLFGINFNLPVGLAAGFDYEARLTQILPSLGFGFGTVGTLTFEPYQGNPRPMLGRLPRSKSLMVNKGFKNLGIEKTLKRLQDKSFSYPVGISIGKTNTTKHKTQEEGIEDVLGAFKIAERSQVPFSYYELNISCPNVSGSVEFYEPRNLRELLQAVQNLGVKKPVFIKMPISKTNDEILSMMDVIVEFPFVKAVILGNLQKDRSNPALQPDEVAKFTKGNFSGAPCQSRSDELIKLVYKNYGDKIKIIGCGGIFSAEDAYRKIKYGASLIQLITGMIFEGPQLVSEINRGLVKLLKQDGYKNISEAVGKES